MQRQTIEEGKLHIYLCGHKIVTRGHAQAWTEDNLYSELCKVNAISIVKI